MKKIIHICSIVLLLFIESIGYSQPNTTIEKLWSQIKDNFEFKNSDVYSIDSIYGANQTIKLLYGTINTPNYNSRVFFIDDKPDKFWGHPCRIIFCNPQDMKLETMSLNFPPNNLNRMILLTPKKEAINGKLFDYTSFKRAGTPKSDSKLKSAESKIGNDYAVIISGGSADGKIGNSIFNSCEAVYSALKYTYAFSEDNIYTLIGNGIKFRNVIVDYEASLQNISKVFDELKSKVTSNDRVFIYCMDHGGKTADKNSYLVIHNDLLFDYDLASEINKLSACSVSIFMGQCYSGGFIDNLSNKNTIIATACNWNEESSATPDILYSEFTYHFVSAITGKNPTTGAVINADENNDGYVSISEAFYYAKDHDRFKDENPQYNSRPAKLGKITTLNNSNATTNPPTPKQTVHLNFRSSTMYRDDCNPIKNDPDSFLPLNWKVSHGSPNLEAVYDIIDLEAESGPIFADRTGEGIFIGYNFLGGHKYSFEFDGDDDYYGDIPDGYTNDISLDVRAANNLSPTSYEECDQEKMPDVPATCDQVATPDCPNSKVIYWSFAPHGILPNQLGSQTADFTFDKYDKYSQLWLSANQKVGWSKGRVMLSHVGITDDGIYVPDAIEQTAYTPVPNTYSNVIFGDQDGTGSLDPYQLIGNPLQTTYQWKQSFDKIDWQDISGATGRNYDPPLLNKTTYFKRVADGYPESNIITISIAPLPELPCSPGEPFDCNKSYWSISHGNPTFVIDKLMGPTIRLNWEFYVTGSGINNYRESDGVYLNYNFEKGKEYTISFYLYDLCAGYNGSHLQIYAASGINPHPGNRKQVETNADKAEKIWDGSGDSWQWKKISLKYSPNDNYSSIWIYPSGNWNESSCNGDDWIFQISNFAIMLEENTVGPITISETLTEKGKVINTSGITIINSGADVNFLAQDEINLNIGFKAVPGSHFSAIISNIYTECPEAVVGYAYSSNNPKGEVDEVNIKSLAIPDLLLYPNPSNGIFTVKMTSIDEPIERIEIYNSNGVMDEILTNLNTSVIAIDMSNAPSNTYFVRVISKNKVYNKKIIKL